MSKFWLLIFTLAFLSGQLFRFSFFSPDVHFIPLDIFMALFLAFFLFTDFHRFFQVLISNPLVKPVFGFLLVGLISLSLAYFRYGSNAFFVGLFYWLRWSVYTLSFVPFLRLSEIINLKKYLLGLGLLTAGTGIIQYLVHPDITGLTISEWDPHYFRVVGTLLDPGYLGIILIFTLIVFSFLPIRKLLYKWLFVYLPFAFTYSRSSFLAYTAGMAGVAYFKNSRKFFLVTFLLLLVTLPLLPRVTSGEGVKLERTSSIFARINSWKNTLTIFTKYPVFGVGFNTYRYAQKEFGFIDNSKWLKSHAGAGADSSLLFVAATTGSLGLVIFLIYLYQLFRLPSNILKSSLIALFLHSAFLNSLFYPFILVWIAILTADALTGVYKKL